MIKLRFRNALVSKFSCIIVLQGAGRSPSGPEARRGGEAARGEAPGGRRAGAGGPRAGGERGHRERTRAAARGAQGAGESQTGRRREWEIEGGGSVTITRMRKERGMEMELYLDLWLTSRCSPDRQTDGVRHQVLEVFKPVEMPDRIQQTSLDDRHSAFQASMMEASLKEGVRGDLRQIQISHTFDPGRPNVPLLSDSSK